MHVLLFALYRDLAGTGACDITLNHGSTAAHAVAALRARGAGFARLPEHPVVAINREFAALDTVLRDGDELALLPPVAGG